MSRIPLFASTLLIAAFANVAHFAHAQDEPKKKSPKPTEAVIDVRLTDMSTLRLTLLDSAIELMTPHGKLTFPVSEVRKIDLGLRVPEDIAKQIELAVADLGSNDFRKREAGTGTLLKHLDKSVPAVRNALKSTDAEVVKRAEELLEKLEGLVPAGRMEVPEHDVLYTDKSKIAGQILTPTLKAKSFAFGEVQLKLSDAIALSTTGFKDDTEVAGALPDPGTLTAYQGPGHVGKTYHFKVIGAAQGSLWGTGMYTLDSSLAAAAVHMGVAKVGQPATVKVTILGPSVNFVGSTQNGLTSSPYANYPGAYQISVKGR